MDNWRFDEEETEEFTHNESPDVTFERFMEYYSYQDYTMVMEDDVERLLDYYLSNRFRWSGVSQTRAMRAIFHLARCCRDRSYSMDVDNSAHSLEQNVRDRVSWRRVWVCEQPEDHRGSDVVFQ